MIRLSFPLFAVEPAVACLAFLLAGAAARGAEHAIEAAAPAAAHPETHANTAAPEASAAPESSAAETPATQKRPAGEVKSLLAIGDRLSARGDYDAAEIAFRQVFNGADAAPEEIKSGLLSLALMHRKQGALTKAAAIYERYLKDYPGDDRAPDALLNLGRTLRDLGVYKLAIARFYSVINSTMKLPGEGLERYQVLTKTAQFEIAETHFQAGAYAEANKFYTRLRLLDLAPADRARAHFKAAFAQRLQGDVEGATSSLRAFVDQWPNDENIPEARYLMAVGLRELKRPREAFASTLELLRTEKSRLEADPKRWAYWQRRTGNQLANDFFESGDTLNAQAIYIGLVDLSPEPVWRLPIVYQLALCYERLGANDRARLAYTEIVTAAGANPPADLVELAKMAAWRIEHLDWRDRVGSQVTAFFGPAAAKTAGAPAPAAAAAKISALP